MTIASSGTFLQGILIAEVFIDLDRHIPGLFSDPWSLPNVFDLTRDPTFYRLSAV